MRRPSSLLGKSLPPNQELGPDRRRAGLCLAELLVLRSTPSFLHHPRAHSILLWSLQFSLWSHWVLRILKPRETDEPFSQWQNQGRSQNLNPKCPCSKARQRKRESILLGVLQNVQVLAPSSFLALLDFSNKSLLYICLAQAHTKEFLVPGHDGYDG